MNKNTVALVMTGVMVGLSGPASAYVRTQTSAGVPTAWKTPCVTMKLALGTFPAHLDAAGYLNAAQQGSEAWTQASLDGISPCSNVRLGVEATPDLGGQVGRDGINRIVFRQTEWCRDPTPTGASEPRCYDPGALAITTVFQLMNSGEILDADIEVNAVNFTWVDFVTQSQLASVQSHDFQGTITHEMGHVLGLEHTCYIPTTDNKGNPTPRPVDHTGTSIPNCGLDNPPLITDATMYVSVSSPATEVGLRTLSPDDVQGVCDVYAFSPAFVCDAPSDVDTSDEGGCSLGANRGPGSIAVVLALAGLALHLGRKRRMG